MTTDKWARWLRTGRDGDSPALRERFAGEIAAYRDGVLDRAGLRPADVVLDVGAGTGLIGLGALDRLGPDGRVIFSDVSAPLLEDCRRAAGGDPRCTFVEAAADDLAGVADGSIDVVTLRSVLSYSNRKAAAVAEFFRVLRPGGRLSLFEPINGFLLGHGPYRLFGLPDAAVDDLLAKVGTVYRSVPGAAAQVMVDFDERDLVAWARAAGFTAVALDFHAEVDAPAAPITDWPGLRATAPNPLVPTYGEAIAAALTGAEQARLDRHMTALVAAGTLPRRTLAYAYLTATKSG